MEACTSLFVSLKNHYESLWPSSVDDPFLLPGLGFQCERTLIMQGAEEDGESRSPRIATHLYTSKVLEI